MPDIIQTQHEVGQPKETANVTPLGSTFAQTRQIIEAVMPEVQKDRNADIWRYLGVYAFGFLTLAGMFLFGYLRLTDKIEPIDRTVIRIEQKLDDLIARIPPVQTPAPRR